MWGPGKLAAVREWAAGHDVDVAASFAYSDCFYDVPLLSAVGHPDRRQPRPAAAAAWPPPAAGRSLHFDVPPGVPKLAGIEPADGRSGPSPEPQLFPWVRFDIDGIDNIPLDGPGDPRRQPPHLLRPAGRRLDGARRPVGPVRFLGKKEVFDAPVVGQLVAALGGIRVERGTGSDEPLQEAAGPWRPARSWRSCRRARSRGVEPSSTPS